MRTRFCLMAALCLIPTLLRGQEAVPGDDGDAITVQQWVERLESKKFSIRNEATRQLQQRGLSVIDQLEEIALKSTTESADRAFEVLKLHHAGDDPTLQVAAAEVLKRIAETEGHAKASAAAEILDPPSEVPRRSVPMRIPMAIPGNLQIQIQGRLGGNALGRNVRTRVQVKIVNGKKDITVEENGKKLRVFENDKGIRVEKTEAGKTDTKQYKDLQELKAKDPEAAKRFENNGRGMNIRIGVNPLGGGQQPAINPDIRKRIEEMRKQQQQRIDQLRKEHEQRREEALNRHRETLKKLRDSQPEVPPLPRRPKAETEEIEEIDVKSIKVIDV